MSQRANPRTSPARPNYIGATWTKPEMEAAWDRGYEAGWEERGERPDDDRELRREALDAALRSPRTGMETDQLLAARAERFYDFLRGLPENVPQKRLES